MFWFQKIYSYDSRKYISDSRKYICLVPDQYISLIPGNKWSDSRKHIGLIPENKCSGSRKYIVLIPENKDKHKKQRNLYLKAKNKTFFFFADHGSTQFLGP